MDLERRSMRVGLAAISCAVAFRVLSGGVLAPLAAALENPRVASFLVYMETGRVARYKDNQAEPTPTAVDVESTSVPQQSTPEPVVFTQADAALLETYDFSTRDVDAWESLSTPLSWDLTQEGPAVLIVHTHATEGYTKQAGQSYVESAAYRTLDGSYNMLRVGDAVAEILEENGIQVLHDRTLHDHPSYNGAYTNSRKTVEEYLAEYPSIRLVLDLHRDAADASGGMQLSTSATVGGQASAQVMMVVGTDGGGSYHPDWKANLALAVKLHIHLQKTHPGICRPLCLRDSRFNQDLSPGALLIEVGAAGNSLEEALVAAEALAWGIVDLSRGSVTEDSAS